MRGGERREVREAGDALEDPRGDERALADLCALRVGQPGGFVEDAVGDRKLADVVEHRRAPQVGDLGLVGAERGGDAVWRARRQGRSGGRSTATSRR